MNVSRRFDLRNDGDQISKPKEKVWIEAYGCSASMNDSEIISGLLRNDGYEISEIFA